jgi:hypothetical protein
MVVRYQYLRGSDLLIIFQKFLEFKGTTPFKWINELITDLFNTNLEEFIKKVDNGEIDLSANPDLNKYFVWVKMNYFESKVKQHEI